MCKRFFLQNVKYKNITLYPAIITATSCSLLIDATSAVPYCLAVIIAILSKYLFRFNNKHYFNPANFAVVIMLLWFPYNFNLAQNIFASMISMAIIFFIFGIIISFLAKQIFTSLFWLLGFCFFAIFRNSGELSSYFQEIRILFSSAMLLFSFNMITDPVTAPKTIRGKFFYGFTIAAFDAMMRAMFIPYGNFYALFIVSSLMPVVSTLNYNKFIQKLKLKII